MPITKHNFIVKEIEDLAPTLRKAFKIAKSGRPGPVLVDITKDVTANKIDFESKKPEEIKRYSDMITEDDLNTVRIQTLESQKAAQEAEKRRDDYFSWRWCRNS